MANIQDLLDQLAGSNSGEAAINSPAQPSKILNGINQDLNAVFLALATGNNDSPLPQASQSDVRKSEPINTTQVKNEAEFIKLKAALERAYPDQKIDIQFDKATGSISGTIPTIDQPKSNPAFATPGFQSGQLASGFETMKSQIEAAQARGDNKEVVNLATSLKRITTDQKLANYNKYLQQANEQNGIPDLMQAIESVKKAESLDPNNPRDGRISDQRMHLLTQLGQARSAARGTLQELLNTDTVVLQAENFADSTLAKFKLFDDLLRLSVLEDKELAQKQQIQEYKDNPKMLDRIAAITLGKYNPDQVTRDQIATRLGSGNLKLDPFIQEMIKKDSNELRNSLLNPEFSKKLSPTQKLQTMTLLLADEIKLTGDETQAKKNIAVLNKIISTDVESLINDKTENIPGDIRMNSQKELSDASVKEKTLSGKALEESRVNTAMNIRNRLLQSISNSEFTKDVQSWKGVFQSDPIAKQVVQTIAKPGERISAEKFITSYINYNDQRKLSERVSSLRGIVQSASDAMRGSSVLPDPSGASMLLLIDRIGAQALTNRIGGNLFPFSDAARIAVNL